MPDLRDYAQQREEMLDKQLRRRGITHVAVLAAMQKVPRHEFVPPDLRGQAYEDIPLPIGSGQTISQPYIVAAMTAALRVHPGDRVLEIGTGCGYQAAVLSLLAREVFSIERRAELASSASQRLERLGFSNVHVHCGDGSVGLPELAPFDDILVAAAAPAVPKPLLDQLAQEGRMIIPIGDADSQDLQLIERHGEAFPSRLLEGCRFVPLVGHHGWLKSP